MSRISSDQGVASSLASGIASSGNVESVDVSFSVTRTTPTSEMQEAASAARNAVSQVRSSLISISQGFTQIAASFAEKDASDAG